MVSKLILAMLLLTFLAFLNGQAEAQLEECDSYCTSWYTTCMARNFSEEYCRANLYPSYCRCPSTTTTNPSNTSVPECTSDNPWCIAYDDCTTPSNESYCRDKIRTYYNCNCTPPPPPTPTPDPTTTPVPTMPQCDDSIYYYYTTCMTRNMSAEYCRENLYPNYCTCLSTTATNPSTTSSPECTSDDAWCNAYNDCMTPTNDAYCREYIRTWFYCTLPPPTPTPVPTQP